MYPILIILQQHYWLVSMTFKLLQYSIPNSCHSLKHVIAIITPHLRMSLSKSSQIIYLCTKPLSKHSSSSSLSSSPLFSQTRPPITSSDPSTIHPLPNAIFLATTPNHTEGLWWCGGAAELIPNYRAAVSGVLFQLQKCTWQSILLTFLLFQQRFLQLEAIPAACAMW